jgi:hypothetical protein
VEDMAKKPQKIKLGKNIGASVCVVDDELLSINFCYDSGATFAVKYHFEDAKRLVIGLNEVISMIESTRMLSL